MKLNAYTIFDVKALQYHSPFFASTDAAAIRSLRDLANDQNTTVGRHPADYVMYQCGTYDDATGRFHPNEPLSHVVDAVALVELQPRMPTLFDNISTHPAAVSNANGKG